MRRLLGAVVVAAALCAPAVASADKPISGDPNTCWSGTSPARHVLNTLPAIACDVSTNGGEKVAPAWLGSDTIPADTVVCVNYEQAYGFCNPGGSPGGPKPR